jgi:hypothetical protein
MLFIGTYEFANVANIEAVLFHQMLVSFVAATEHMGCRAELAAVRMLFKPLQS